MCRQHSGPPMFLLSWLSSGVKVIYLRRNLCLCSSVRFRSHGQRSVSGWDDGLQADADGGFLSESWDRAALSQWDRESLLRSAPQRTNTALLDGGRQGRRGSDRSQLSAGGESKNNSNNGWLKDNGHRQVVLVSSGSMLSHHFTFHFCQWVPAGLMFFSFLPIHSSKLWFRKPTQELTTASTERSMRLVSLSSRLPANTSATETPCESCSLFLILLHRLVVSCSTVYDTFRLAYASIQPEWKRFSIRLRWRSCCIDNSEFSSDLLLFYKRCFRWCHWRDKN